MNCFPDTTVERLLVCCLIFLQKIENEVFIKNNSHFLARLPISAQPFFTTTTSGL
jgi:hypothetical protein